MKPMKSTKYRKHRASKHIFPTTQVHKNGTLYGEKPARQDIERRLGRKLADDTITRHTWSQWVFCEPKAVPA
jgi:hypothetical protein